MMNRAAFMKQACLLGGGAMVWLPKGWAQGPAPVHEHHQWFLSHVRPWPRPHPMPHPRPVVAPVEVRAIEAVARIEGQKARTTLTLEFFNPDGRRPQEGQVLLPVPHGAVLSSFRLEGSEGSLEAELLPREEARRIYDGIVRQLKDPAILEFAGYGAVRSGVFPVPARGSVKIRIVYDELLPIDGERVEYVLPRSESLDYRVDWRIEVNWVMKGGIAMTFSPSHEIRTKDQGEGVRVQTAGTINAGSFRLSVLRRGGHREPVASFLSHPDEKGGGGWFLLLISPPKLPAGVPKLAREVTVVLDRSGSMAGEKLDQARAATLQVIEGLEEEDHFNIIIYNEAVELFVKVPCQATRENILRARSFINGIRVSGGTNIHGALSAAVAQPTREGLVPIVLFLTDGLPTIGETSEKRIRESINEKNQGRRRLFTFGVGVDVNTPLLSRLADDSRATASYVLPGERVEVKVGQVFARLAGPVLERPVLTVVNRSGERVPGRVDDVIPNRLPDFFSGDQIVVTGRYRGTARLAFRLAGASGAKARKFRFGFVPSGLRNPFVPRLWATRKIAILTEALRDLGADGSMGGLTGDRVDRHDPRVMELVDEIVRLSTEHGILTEYTAFLARDGAVFRPVARQNEVAAGNFDRRALQKRSGADGVNQEYNLWSQKAAACANPTNRFLNAELKQEVVGNVQQAADKAYYKQGDHWVDAEIVGNTDLAVEEIAVGSDQFNALVDRLVATQRQSCLALGNKLEIMVDGKRYRIR